MKITKYMGAFAVIAMLAACSTDDELGANTAANCLSEGIYAFSIFFMHVI